MSSVVWGYAIGRERRQSLQDTSVAMAMRGGFEVPDEIDPRSFIRVEDQRQIGSCQGNAITSVMEYLERVATSPAMEFDGESTRTYDKLRAYLDSPGTQLSRWWAYRMTQERDGITGDNGSTIAGGVDMASEDGVPPESLCPYPSSGRYESGFVPSREASLEAPKRKIQSHTVLETYQQVFDYIATGQGAVTFGCSWGVEPVNGIINRFDAGGGGHANAFLGFSKRMDSKGRKFLWDCNSWGTQWGNGGWAEWSPDAVDAMLRHPYSVAVGCSDMTTPECRKITWATIF